MKAAGRKNGNALDSGGKKKLNNTFSKSSLGASFQKQSLNLSKTQTRRMMFEGSYEKKTNNSHKKSLASSLSKSHSKHNFRPVSPSPNRSKANVKQYDEKIRKKNEKYIPRCNSSQNLKARLPWGVNECRLNNYVLQTLEKMHKIRKQEKSRRQLQKQSNKEKQFREQTLTPQKKKFNSSKPKQDKISQLKNQIQSSISKTVKKKERKIQQKIQQTNSELLSMQVKHSFTGKFVEIQKNDMFAVNFRIIKENIMEIQIAVNKKIEQLNINLQKGSLMCQSISESYSSIDPKSSLIVMSAVQNCKNLQNYKYPCIRIEGLGQNKIPHMIRKVLVPFSWLHAIRPIPPQFLQKCKFENKIKNKSSIDHRPSKKRHLESLRQIFQNNYSRHEKNKVSTYIFGFMNNECKIILKYSINTANHRCSLQCQSQVGSNTSRILELFDQILGL